MRRLASKAYTKSQNGEGSGRGQVVWLLWIVAQAALDDQASAPRGMTLTVAERAPALIIGLRYGLPWYFAL